MKGLFPYALQVFVMGPIVVMVRRPSLHIPVPPEDVQEEAGAIQTIARISSFQSEMAGNAVLQGDPPQWLVQARPLHAVPPHGPLMQSASQKRPWACCRCVRKLHAHGSPNTALHGSAGDLPPSLLLRPVAVQAAFRIIVGINIHVALPPRCQLRE